MFPTYWQNTWNIQCHHTFSLVHRIHIVSVSNCLLKKFGLHQKIGVDYQSLWFQANLADQDGKNILIFGN